MPLYLAIAITILMAAVLVFYGGYLFLVILALIVSLYIHLSAQLKTRGKWQLDTSHLAGCLIMLSLLTFVALVFPFFPLTLHNILITAAVFLGLCGYSILMSLKKVDR